MMWKADRSPDATGRLENLKELVKALEEFDSLPGFLEHVSLVMENASEPNADLTNVMTLHGAKGLEFDAVFLCGWEEGLFPNQRAIDDGGGKALEEERRLAYVGMTRARRRLSISFAANRRVYGQWQSSVPSRFVEELPAEHIQHLHRQVPGATGQQRPLRRALLHRAAQPLPLAAARSEGAGRPGRGRGHAARRAGQHLQAAATASSTRSSATGRSRGSRATSSTSRSRSRAGRR